MMPPKPTGSACVSRLDGPVSFRGGGFAPRDRAWLAAVTLVGLVLLWQAGASAGLILA